jgi:hypothetical protein
MDPERRTVVSRTLRRSPFTGFVGISVVGYGVVSRVYYKKWKQHVYGVRLAIDVATTDQTHPFVIQLRCYGPTAIWANENLKPGDKVGFTGQLGFVDKHNPVIHVSDIWEWRDDRHVKLDIPPGLIRGRRYLEAKYKDSENR